MYQLVQMLKPESLPESYAQLDFLIGKAINYVKYEYTAHMEKADLKPFFEQTRVQLVGIARAFDQYYFGHS
jgi:hypothetical protein